MGKEEVAVGEVEVGKSQQCVKSSYIGILYVNSGGGSYKLAKCKQLQATDM